MKLIIAINYIMIRIRDFGVSGGHRISGLATGQLRDALGCPPLESEALAWPGEAGGRVKLGGGLLLLAFLGREGGAIVALMAWTRASLPCQCKLRIY